MKIGGEVVPVSRDRLLAERVLDGITHGKTTSLSPAVYFRTHNADSTTPISSSLVSGIGLPFMLLAFAALSASRAASPDEIP